MRKKIIHNKVALISNVFFPYHKGCSLRREFAPFGSKFFPLRVAPSLEAILGIVYKILGVRKNNSLLATLLMIQVLKRSL